jgi:hypothetical protein
VLNELARGTDKGRRFSDASAAKDRAAWRVLKRHYPDKTEGQCREIIRIDGLNEQTCLFIYSLRRRVFAAGLLGVDTFRSALFVLQASDARPGAVEIVADRDVQRAAALAG